MVSSISSYFNEILLHCYHYQIILSPGNEADEATSVTDDTRPKGPYTQQIEGVLPPIFTEIIIYSHLSKSGK